MDYTSLCDEADDMLLDLSNIMLPFLPSGNENVVVTCMKFLMFRFSLSTEKIAKSSITRLVQL